MSSPADATINALLSGHDELVALVSGMSVDQLTGPSACSDWDVSQVLSHLGSGAEIAKGTLARAVDPAIPAVPNAEIWDRWNAMSPQQRLTEFIAADTELLAVYEGFDDATRNDLKIDMGFLPMPVDVATAARFRLNEFALHSWDVRSVLDPDATVAADAVPLLIDHTGFMMGWIGHGDAVNGEVTLAVETVAPARRFGLTIADKVSLSDEAVPAAGSLALPAEAWLRLTTGRLGEGRTPASVSLGSDAITLEDLRRVFPGF